MDDKTGNESNSVQQLYGADYVHFSHSVLTQSFPDAAVGKVFSGVSFLECGDFARTRSGPWELEFVLQWKGNTVEFHSCTRNNRLATDELLLELP